MNNLQKKHQQKLDWLDSETGKMPSDVKIAARVNFQSSIQFLAACSSVDMEEVIRLLNEGVDINVGNVDGLTALHQACIDSNLNLVEFLIEHGSNMDIPDREGWTPLHAAVSCGFIEIVKYLVDRGARLDALSFDNELPIDVVNSDDKKMREYLLAAMLERRINSQAARDVERRVMLRDAQIWLESGTYEPDIDRVTMATPLHIAASKNYVDVMSVLLQIPQVNVNAFDADGWTPLHSAAHWGQREACELLTNHPGLDMEAMTFTNQSILDLADKELRDFLYAARRRFHENKRAFQAEANMINNYGKRKRLSLTRLSTAEKQQIGDKVSAEEGSTLRECGLVPNEPITILNEPSEVTAVLDVTDSTETVTATVDVDTSSIETPTPEVTESVDIELTLSDVVNGTDNVSVNNENVNIQLPEEDSVIIITSVTDDDSATTTVTFSEEPEQVTVTSKDDPQSDTQGRNKLSAVLSPEKAEKEAQRTTRARQARASRRSTQGVTLEDIQAAKEFGSDSSSQDKKVPDAGSTVEAAAVTEKLSTTVAILTPTVTISPSSPSPSRESKPSKRDDTAHEMNKPETSSAVNPPVTSVVDDEDSLATWRQNRQSRRSRGHPTVVAPANDAPDANKLINASGDSSALSNRDSTRLPKPSEEADKQPPPPDVSNLRNENTPPTNEMKPSSTHTSRRVTWLNPINNVTASPAQKETTPIAGQNEGLTDYEQLYRLEIQLKEQLLQKLKELQHEKEASENDLARLRKSAHMGILNKSSALRDSQITAQKMTEYDERLKEIDRLKQENVKMKEENVALVGVIRRLSRSRVG